MNGAITLVKAMVDRFESLAPLLKEHIADNMGQILPHVFFGDLTRYILALVAAVSSGAGLEPRCELRDILDFLEKSYAIGDLEIKELVCVSFLENLPRSGEAGSEVRSMLGAALSAELRRMG